MNAETWSRECFIDIKNIVITVRWGWPQGGGVLGPAERNHRGSNSAYSDAEHNCSYLNKKTTHALPESRVQHQVERAPRLDRLELRSGDAPRRSRDRDDLSQSKGRPDVGPLEGNRGAAGPAAISTWRRDFAADLVQMQQQPISYTIYIVAGRTSRAECVSTGGAGEPSWRRSLPFICGAHRYDYAAPAGSR